MIVFIIIIDINSNGIIFQDSVFCWAYYHYTTYLFACWWHYLSDIHFVVWL